MAVPFEIAVAVAVAVVAASYWAAARNRVGERVLRRLAAVFGGLALTSAVVLAIALASGRGDWEPILVAVGAFLLAGAAEAGAVVLLRGLAHLRALDDQRLKGLGHIERALDQHAAARAAELEHTLLRERAETSHLILEQERQLRDERVAAVEAQARQAHDELASGVTDAQDRLAQRVAAWSTDLERSHRELKERLEGLIERQASALVVHEERLESHASEIKAMTSAQHGAIERLRADFAHQLAEVFAEAVADVDAQAAEQRRALSDLTERLRVQSRSLREEAEREEAEARARLSASIPEIERRVVEQLQRSLDRATDRLVEEAERRFDVQVRQSREETAARLARELEKSLEHFTKQAEKDVAARMTEVAHTTARRLQRQLDEVVRAAEAQTSLAEERIAFLTSRFDKAVDDAAGRLAAFETDLELELSAKLAEFERAFRHAEQAVGRETS